MLVGKCVLLFGISWKVQIIMIFFFLETSGGYCVLFSFFFFFHQPIWYLLVPSPSFRTYGKRHRTRQQKLDHRKKERK